MTYKHIENGAYVTLHRIASDGKHHGIFNAAIKYCKSIHDNIRIETHKNNIIIQKQIEKNICKRQITKNSMSVDKIIKAIK